MLLLIQYNMFIAE